LAAFLAHTIGNTNKFERPTPVDGTLVEPEYPPINQGLFRMFDKDCPQNDEEIVTALSAGDRSCMG